MSTKLYSFMDIFNTTSDDNQENIQLKKIIIPIIQRDYAQGRKSADIIRIRERFLDSLYKAVTEKPITLDFIYGDVDADGNMIPLDGQQRLTTLFLLHWYAAKKDNISETEYNFLKNFSYETRYSARYFCIELVNYNPNFKMTLSKEIINQAWFPLDWKKDSTISSMLVMLDAIDGKFKNVQNLWNKLKERCITFYFLPIKDMGLTDELYIKMNSRGKPLTLFEHFKAELEHEIQKTDENIANRINYKIDCDWTNLLWEYHDNNKNTIDDKFLCYFKFICDIICYRQNELPFRRSYDEFDLLHQYFSDNCQNAVKNLETFEKFMDCWCKIPGYNSPTDFLSSFISNKHEEGKILVEYNVNIFKECLDSYFNKYSFTRSFQLSKFVLLYAITTYLQNMDKVTELEFKRRIRILHNLIMNSQDEISDRADRNRMTAILKESDAIILTGAIDDSIKNSFNTIQLNEEKEKIKYLEIHPNMADILFKLEDHNLLNGQIGIVGLENLNYTDRFYSLFNCNQDKINCALMAIGDYGQIEKNNWRYQYGSTTKDSWTSLFHKSANSYFEKTKEVLISLLATNENFSNEILKNIINDYLQECEDKKLYPFRYYYIKYSEYRPQSYGKMYNEDANRKPYMFLVMQTKSYLSRNSYYPYLKVADESHLSKDDMGQRLTFENKYITCENSSYLVKTDDNILVDTITIAQNKDGIDTEDRIIRLKEYIKNTFYT